MYFNLTLKYYTSLSCIIKFDKQMMSIILKPIKHIKSYNSIFNKKIFWNYDKCYSFSKMYHKDKFENLEADKIASKLINEHYENIKEIKQKEKCRSTTLK